MTDLMSPGDLLVALLDYREMTQGRLATAIGRPAQMVSEIRHGKKRITAQTAQQLQQALGLPAPIWLAAQAHADLIGLAPRDH